MKLYQVKDIVREHHSRIGLPTEILTLALDGGRREVEKAGNWYWMRATKTFNLTTSTSSYPITTSGGVALNLPKFKGIRRLYQKLAAAVQWNEVILEQLSLEEAELVHTTTATGAPAFAAVDNLTLIVLPIPDVAYNMKMWHYEWTDNPTLNTDTNELIDRFPEALIYGALVWTYEIYLKDARDALLWSAKLDKEIAKIRQHEETRDMLGPVAPVAPITPITTPQPSGGGSGTI